MPSSAPRIVLVAMPWESVARPSLALGTLRALAAQRGYRCTVLHLNLDCAASIGHDTYEAFSENVELFPLGEHLFATDLFGTAALDSEEYLARFGATPTEVGDAPDPLHRLRDEQVRRFLDDAADAVLGESPDVVGFSCTFNQVLPSLALAGRLKRRSPGTTVLIGGASVHGEMGRTYARLFPDLLDHVFTGEADISFPDWLDAYAGGDPRRPIPGIASGEHSVPARPTADLDRLPVPDFEPFFTRRRPLEDAGHLRSHVHHLPFESSRGCWWGQKHHCTFCGLNNDGMAYRRKSPARVVAELEELSGRYGTSAFMAADNILDHGAYGELLHLLARSPVDFDLFYEIKANVRRTDVATLRRAGVVRVQPGVESFSDAILTLMRKGVTTLQNVQLLKWLQEFGISVDYNILVGFPGETDVDYGEMRAVLPGLAHLPPPNGKATVVRVDRFAPFFRDPEGLGIRGLRPAAHYRHLIPTERGPAEEYAYFFDRDLDEVDGFAGRIAELDDLIEEWKQADVRRLARLGVQVVEIVTYRGRSLRRYVLRGVEALVFVVCDAYTSVPALHRRLAAVAAPAEVEAAVESLVDDAVLLASRGRLVSTVPFAEPHTQDDLDRWLGVMLPSPAPEPAAVTAARVPGPRLLPLVAADPSGR